MDIGKKVYRSTAVGTIKVMAIVIIVVLLINLYFQTFYDPEFSKQTIQDLKAVFLFHVKYPYDLLSYICFILFPCIYFGFFRGVVFFENAIVVNRGLPFLNTIIKYDEIKTYEIIHSKLIMSVTRKKKEDEIFFTINNVDRAIAIFDQNKIQGDLSSKIKLPINMQSRIIVLLIAIGLSVLIGQTSLSLSRFLFR